MKNWYKRIKQGSSGITLISLVVTVIILLILATVGIYSGITAINSSKLTRFTTQMKLMQLEVNELYEAYTTGGSIKTKDGNQYTGEMITTIGKNLNEADQEQLDNVFRPDWEDGSGILNREGYRYFDKETIENLEIEGIDEEFLINVETRTVISYEGLKYDDKMYYTLEQVPDSLYNVDYENPNTGKPTFDLRYEKLESGKWKIIVSNIRFEEEEQGFINKWQVKYQYADTQEPDKWNISDNLEFIVDVADEYRVVVFQQGVESEIKTIKISDIPTDPVDENTIYKDPESNNKEAYIPKGFKVSEEPTEQKIDTGLVVIDQEGNEYVWIPCTIDGAEETVVYSREETKWGMEKDNNSPAIKDELTLLDAGVTYTELDIENGINQEISQEIVNQINAEKASIEKYKGFYIGRYEVGKENNEAVIKQNKEPYTNIKWIEAYHQAKEIGGGTAATTYLCSSYAWDTALQYIETKTGNTDYGTNVSKYNGNWQSKNVLDKYGNIIKKAGEAQKLNTGLTTPVYNIYDMGGNVAEYTTELNPGISETVMLRGGHYKGDTYAGFRWDAQPNNSDIYYGFRSTLFIK